MLSSPRNPESTILIFSSAENWRRVARRIFLTTCSAGSFTGPDFCPIFAPSMATMGQKSSLPQLSKSVSEALMPDRIYPRCAPLLHDLPSVLPTGKGNRGQPRAKQPTRTEKGRPLRLAASDARGAEGRDH